MKRSLNTLFWVATIGLFFTACSKKDDPQPKSGTGKTEKLVEKTAEEELNEKVHNHLRTYYLYNDEYKTLNPNFKQAYDKFLTNTLMSMKTNVLDKKKNSKGKYQLFSYIEKLDPNLTGGSGTSSSRAAVEAKEKEYTFGIAAATPFLTNINVNGQVKKVVVFSIKGIYPGSPAEKAGLKRGDDIVMYNGEYKDSITWYDPYVEFLLPSKAGITAKMKTKAGKEVELTTVAMECNPILKTHIYKKGRYTIGYLVYESFDSGFDEELFEVFKKFKTSGVTDLIIDLRYNGGGDVQSANLIATCTAGDQSLDKVFASFEYNPTRMKSIVKDEYKFSRTYKNLHDISLSEGYLNLKKVYCLVSGSTASSSELVINSLRGIDVDVVLIGTTTHGKNVGMEVVELEDKDKNKYRLAPITFKSANAKGFSAYEMGFKPNIELDEVENNRKDQIFQGFGDFATAEEIMYTRAIKEITGEAPASTASRAGVRKQLPLGKALTAPQRPAKGMRKYNL